MIFLCALIFFNFTLFAGDNNLTWSFNNMSYANISNSINQNLETPNHWLIADKNKVNTHKSHFIVFSERKKMLSPMRKGTEVKGQTEITKFFGVT